MSFKIEMYIIIEKVPLPLGSHYPNPFLVVKKQQKPPGQFVLQNENDFGFFSSMMLCYVN